MDEIDKTILRTLQEDAKKTAKDIAQKLKMTVSPVYERIRRLESQGYIKRYAAILNKDKNRKTCDMSLSGFHAIP